MESLSKARVRLKLRSRLRVFLMWLIGAPVVLIMMLLSPMVKVRIAELESSIFGHFVYFPELALSSIEESQESGRIFDVWFEQQIISNKALQTMWKRTIRVWPRWLLHYPYELLQLLDFRKHLIPNHRDGRDTRDLISKHSPHISFTEDELNQSRDRLIALGVPEGEPFICVHNRDSYYYNELITNVDWSYQDYRNYDIENAMDALVYLANKGYWVIRVGAGAKGPISVSHPRIIDYARSPNRDDLLDIYLVSHCEFIICCASGIDAVADMFHRPKLFINFTHITGTPIWVDRSLVAFKHYFDAINGQKLSLKDLFGRGLGKGENVTQDYIDANVVLVENTPEEILEAVKEMETMLYSPENVSPEDLELNAAFWRSFPYDPICHGPIIRTRVATSYIKSNSALLSSINQD